MYVSQPSVRRGETGSTNDRAKQSTNRLYARISMFGSRKIVRTQYKYHCFIYSLSLRSTYDSHTAESKSANFYFLRLSVLVQFVGDIPRARVDQCVPSGMKHLFSQVLTSFFTELFPGTAARIPFKILLEIYFVIPFKLPQSFFSNFNKGLLLVFLVEFLL